MLSRTTLTNALKVNSGLVPRRFYSENFVPTTGGGSEDNFKKRERANEDYYIKQHEKEQLRLLREQLEQNKKKLQQIQEKMDNLAKEEETSK